MIALLDLVVLLLVVTLILFLGTQVIWPAIKGTPLFPLLRKSSVNDAIHEVEHKLEEVAQREHLQELSTQLKARTDKLKEGE